MDDLYLDAEHYDRLYPNRPDPFWAKMVETYGNPVLELGSGTGRIALELASAGCDVTGIEQAPAMLERAKQKASERGLAINFVAADARDFDLGRTFKTILFPANALCHILTRSEFEGLAHCVRAHLADDGAFIIDVFVPSPIALTRDPEGRFSFGSYKTATSKTQVTFSSRYDHATQINHITTYTQTDDGETIEGKLDMKMYYPQELESVLAYNGLPIEKRYSTVDLQPFGADSARQLIVCRKA